MLGFVMLLLSDFFGVRYVTWIAHQLIDGFQRLVGRIFRANNVLGSLLALDENFAQYQSSSVVSAHAVNTATGRSGGRTQINSFNCRAVRRGANDGSVNELPSVRV